MAQESFWKKINPFKKNKSIRLGDIYPEPIKIVHVDQTGSTGTHITSGILNEEYLIDLSGTQAADIFDKMRRSDPKIKMCLSAVMNPIKSATWEVVSYDDSEVSNKQRDFIEYALFEKMDKSWNLLIHEILTMIIYGYSLFEKVHKVYINDPKFGNIIVLKNLAYRSQRTIQYWNIDCEENLETVTQFSFGDAQKDNIKIPAEYLVLFNLEQEGLNFEGISLLRPCYGSWLRKNVFLKLQAIGIEKFAVPTPTLKIPIGKENSTEESNAKSVLQKYVSHQSNYITLPQGWEIDFTQTNFDAQKVQSAIDSENMEIVNSFLANFLQLGTAGAGGSYALSFDLSDFFLGGIEYISSQICEVFNKEIIKELIDLNFGPQINYPKLQCSGITDKIGQEFGNLLKALADSKFIVPSDLDEDNIRKRIGLPKRSNIGIRKVDQPKPLFSENKNIKLAEKPKTIIKNSTQMLVDLMKSNLSMIQSNLISKILNKYNNLSDSQKGNAIKDISINGINDYKKQLIDMFATISRMSINNAKKEIPGGRNIKFAEFDELPPEIQKRIRNLSELLTGTQIADLEKAVYFQYNSSITSTSDPAVIEKDLEDAATKYIEGTGILSGASATAAQLVNEARNAFFSTEDVTNQISAYEFVNEDPISPICQDLAGRIIDVDDPDLNRYYPPLHFNCKSYMRPILKSTDPNPELDSRGLKPSTEKAANSIQFGGKKNEHNGCC